MKKELKPICEVGLVSKRTTPIQPMVLDRSEKAAELKNAIYEPGVIGHHECFYVLLCNRAGKLLNFYKASEGGIASTAVDVVLVLQAAILTGASSMILMHNHPSGSLRPSIEDDRLTREIAEAAKFCKIKVHDHLIVTEDGYYSYADNGRI